MAKNIKLKGVFCVVSERFFDKIMEPKRKELEKSLGVRMTQKNFTEFLAVNNAKFVIPKQKVLKGPVKRLIRVRKIRKRVTRK